MSGFGLWGCCVAKKKRQRKQKHERQTWSQEASGHFPNTIYCPKYESHPQLSVLNSTLWLALVWLEIWILSQGFVKSSWIRQRNCANIELFTLFKGSVRIILSASFESRLCEFASVCLSLRKRKVLSECLGPFRKSFCSFKPDVQVTVSLSYPLSSLWLSVHHPGSGFPLYSQICPPECRQGKKKSKEEMRTDFTDSTEVFRKLRWDLGWRNTENQTDRDTMRYIPEF